MGTMGDTVQRLMEGMVPELEDLVARGIFSREELKEVVARRADYEYNLKRRAPVKADYWAYAAYEEGLEAERKRRCRQLYREDRAKARAGVGLEAEASREARQQRLARQSGGRGPSDHAGPRRIAFIYSRAVRRFKRDLDVHLRYVAFCKRNGGTRSAGKAFLGALQMHAGNAALWAEAAFWEYEGNLDPASARALFQRGLRVVEREDARGLWVHYFRMEVMYVEKVLERRRVLGLAAQAGAEAEAEEAGNRRRKRRAEGDAGGASDSERSDEEDNEGEDEGDRRGDRIDVDALPGQSGKASAGASEPAEKRARRDEAEEVRRAGKHTLEAVAGGVVPKIVYKNLCVAYAGEVEPRLQCLDVLLHVERDSAAFPVSCDIAKEVAAEIKCSFPESASALVKCAMVVLRAGGGNVADAVATFDAAIERQRAREGLGSGTGRGTGSRAANVVRRLLCEKATFLHAFVDECRLVIDEQATREGRAADDMSVKSDAATWLAATLPLCLKAYALAAEQGALPAARVVRRSELLAELGRMDAAIESAWGFLKPLTSSSKPPRSEDSGSESESDESDSSDDDGDDNNSPWRGVVHPAELYAAVALLHSAVTLTEEVGGTVDAEEMRRAFVRLIKCANRSIIAVRKGSILNPMWDYTDEEMRDPDLDEEDDDGRKVDDDTDEPPVKAVTLVGASSHLWSNLAEFDSHNHPNGALATAELWLHLKPWSDALQAPDSRNDIEATIARCVFQDAGLDGFRAFSVQLAKHCPSLSLGFFKQAIQIEGDVEVEANSAKGPAQRTSTTTSIPPVRVLFMQATGNGGVGAMDPALWESWMEWCMRRGDFSGAEQVRRQALRSLASGGGVKRAGATSTAPLIEDFEARCQSLNKRIAAAAQG